MIFIWNYNCSVLKFDIKLVSDKYLIVLFNCSCFGGVYGFLLLRKVGYCLFVWVEVVWYS